jgi:hypothetical protein
LCKLTLTLGFNISLNKKEDDMMDLEKIKLTPEAFTRICELLNNNFGEVELKNLNEDDLHYFIATCMEASYKIGVQDGLFFKQE